MLGLAAELFDLNPYPMLVVDVRTMRIVDMNAALRGVRSDCVKPGALLDDVFSIVVDDVFASSLTSGDYVTHSAMALASFRGLIPEKNTPAHVVDRLICSYAAGSNRTMAAMHVLDVEIRQDGMILALVALLPLTATTDAFDTAGEGRADVAAEPAAALAKDNTTPFRVRRSKVSEASAKLAPGQSPLPSMVNVCPGCSGPWEKLVRVGTVSGVFEPGQDVLDYAPETSGKNPSFAGEAEQAAESSDTAQPQALRQDRALATHDDASRSSLRIGRLSLLRAVIDAIPDLFFLKDAQCRYVACNKAVSDLLGLEESFLVGRTDDELLPPNLRESCKAADSRILEGELKVVLDEIVPTRKGNKTFESIKTPFMNEAGQLVGIVCLSRDITRRKEEERLIQEAKRAADEASMAKSSFLANMSHEIRTPMNAITGLSHLALGTDLTERQRDYIKKIQAAGESLLSLINDILDFSKIESGHMTLEHIPFFLDEVLETVSTLFSGKIAEKGLDFIFDIAPNVPLHLLGDPLRVGQILNNLVSNAVKFTSLGEIVLSCRKVSEKNDAVELEFAVRDSGIGMSPEQLEKIFKPFTQADSSTTRNFGGTGLGLTITKRFAEAMGGGIKVESAVGNGSTFRCRVWLEKDLTARVRKLSLPEDGVPCVLVVSAKESVSRSLCTILAGFHVHASVVISPASTRDALLSERSTNGSPAFGLALIDASLENGQGVELTAELQHAGVHAIPMIQNGNMELQARAGALGLHEVLPVPFTFSHVFDLLNGLVRRRSATDGVMPAPASVPSFFGQRVLVVEDNAVNQQIIDELLLEVGLKPVLRANGQEALDELAAHEPDYYSLVLMDLQMPVMDGFTAAQQIRKMPWFGGLPVVALTAHALSEEREKCLRCGMNGHLPKPIKVTQLYEVLRAYLHESAGQNDSSME